MQLVLNSFLEELLNLGQNIKFVPLPQESSALNMAERQWVKGEDSHDGNDNEIPCCK